MWGRTAAAPGEIARASDLSRIITDLLRGWSEEVGSLLDARAGAGEALVELGALAVALLQRGPDLVHDEVAEPLGDPLELVAQLLQLVVVHGRRASSISCIGWRTSRPAAARCSAHPGLADATTGAPERRMEASLRSRMSPARSGCSTEYAPPAPQHSPSSSSSTSALTNGASATRTDAWARCTWRRWHGSWTATARPPAAGRA